MFKIAISGKANTGKNTVGLLLSKNLKDILGSSAESKIIAFADPIKKMAKNMFPNIPNKYLYGSSKFRGQIIPGAFKNGQPLTIRQLLIDIGTRGREYQEDIWIKAFDHTFKKLQKSKKEIVIIPDARFTNEFTYLKTLGFYQIRLLRDIEKTINDPSETNQDAIKDQEFNYLLKNNGTLEELEKEVKKIVSYL